MKGGARGLRRGCDRARTELPSLERAELRGTLAVDEEQDVFHRAPRTLGTGRAREELEVRSHVASAR